MWENRSLQSFPPQTSSGKCQSAIGIIKTNIEALSDGWAATPVRKDGEVLSMMKDLTGMRFGKLTVSFRNPRLEGRYCTWNCQCDCGGQIVVNTKRLTRGTVTNCGCIPKTNRRRGPAPADLTGKVFGSLTVMERAEKKGQRTAWLCRCECGKDLIVTAQDLRKGHTKSCGCKAHDAPYYRDLTGQRIGYLTAMKKTDHRDYKGSVIWQCLCDCGKSVLYSSDSLLHGKIKSCGCYRENELCGKINDTLHRVDGTCIERLNLKKARSDNKSGHIGIQMVDENHYRALIGFQGKRYYLGTFPTLEEAIEARQRGEQIHRDYLASYQREINK